MPIHSTTYRSWDARNDQGGFRWWTICTTGIRRAMTSRWVRRLLFMALLPLFFFGALFFAFEQSKSNFGLSRVFARLVAEMPSESMLGSKIGRVPVSPSEAEFEQMRHPVWAFLLLTFLSYPQSFLMVTILGIVAPPLISQDLRTRAYLIYFSRPITKLHYIAGKFGVVSFFLLTISLLPSLLLYVTAVLLSPDLSVILSTWDLPLRIIAASCCMVIPTSLVALAYSSLTLESRYAGFAWFATWILGHVTYSSLVAIPSLEAAAAETDFSPGWRSLTSPYQVLGLAQSTVMGFDSADGTSTAAFAMLAIVSFLSVWVLMRRVDAPLRA